MQINIDKQFKMAYPKEVKFLGKVCRELRIAQEKLLHEQILRGFLNQHDAFILNILGGKALKLFDS